MGIHKALKRHGTYKVQQVAQIFDVSQVQIDQLHMPVKLFHLKLNTSLDSSIPQKDVIYQFFVHRHRTVQAWVDSVVHFSQLRGKYRQNDLLIFTILS
jgi:hypothetical protein